MVCVHNWNCEPAVGPTSKGTCRECGEEREFSNRLNGEQALQLPWGSDGACLPELSPTKALVVTQEPVVSDERAGSPAMDAGPCRHFWASGEPDERGIAHIYCKLCPTQYWMNEAGDLYDAQLNLLPGNDQLWGPRKVVLRKEKVMAIDPMTRSENGKRPAARYSAAEYDRRFPEILKRLEELDNIGLLAKELGVTYASLQGALKKRGVDVRKYMHGKHGTWHKKEVPAQPASAAPAASALDPMKSVDDDWLDKAFDLLADLGIKQQAIATEIAKVRASIKEYCKNNHSK